MVRWLVLFLVALLPLRGWVGDAMAGQMLGQQVAAAQALAQSAVTPHAHEAAVHHDHATGHDCSHHDTGSTGAAAAQPVPDDCPTCASCQACSALAMVFEAPAPALAAQPSPAPAWAGHGWASAERDAAFKPPIS